MKTNSDSNGKLEFLTAEDVFNGKLEFLTVGDVFNMNDFYREKIRDNFKTHGKENSDETNGLLHDLDLMLRISSGMIGYILQKLEEMEEK